MSMTHYMELLSQNQPWNLILFMAIPVILAETVAITELFILFYRPQGGMLCALNRFASILGGTYFLGVFIYLLFHAVAPLTSASAWRGPADVIAVGFYLSGVVPLSGLALLDVGLIARTSSAERKLLIHAVLVAVFLVVAHVAMVFGMMDPAILSGGAQEIPMEHMMHH